MNLLDSKTGFAKITKKLYEELLGSKWSESNWTRYHLEIACIWIDQCVVPMDGAMSKGGLRPLTFYEIHTEYFGDTEGLCPGEDIGDTWERTGSSPLSYFPFACLGLCLGTFQSSQLTVKRVRETEIHQLLSALLDHLEGTDKGGQFVNSRAHPFSGCYSYQPDWCQNEIDFQDFLEV